jgi:hypothetical protein
MPMAVALMAAAGARLGARLFAPMIGSDVWFRNRHGRAFITASRGRQVVQPQVNKERTSIGLILTETICGR